MPLTPEEAAGLEAARRIAQLAGNHIEALVTLCEHLEATDESAMAIVTLLREMPDDLRDRVALPIEQLERSSIGTQADPPSGRKTGKDSAEARRHAAMLLFEAATSVREVPAPPGQFESRWLTKDYEDRAMLAILALGIDPKTLTPGIETAS